jgi:hypothetical protein
MRYVFKTGPEQLHPDLETEHKVRFGRALFAIWEPTTSLGRLRPGDLTNWHRRLLRGLEPDERVGVLRHHGEQSTYDIWKTSDSGDEHDLEHCACLGLDVPADKPNAIWDAVDQACEAFGAAVDARQREPSSNLDDAVRPCAELYVALLRIRPFATDNDQIAYLALHAAFRRMGLEPLIYAPRLPGDEEELGRAAIGLDFNHALARSLQPNARDIGSLTAFLTRHTAFR